MAVWWLFVYLFLLLSVTGYNLSNLYIGEFHLVAGESPYIIVSDITIRSTSKFFIHNGVEIIFMDNYTISVSGEFHAGCLDFNTSSITDIVGLADPNNFTYIHGLNTSSQIGRISLQTHYDVSSFCNTKFENMWNAIYVEEEHGYGQFMIDNCEFSNLYAPINVTQYIINRITDSYIHDITWAGGLNIYYYHLLVTNFHHMSVDTITNSTIIGMEKDCYIQVREFENNRVTGSCTICMDPSRSSKRFTRISGCTFIDGNSTYQLQLPSGNHRIENNIFNGHIGTNVIFYPGQYPSDYEYTHSLEIVDNTFINNINAFLINARWTQLTIDNNKFVNNSVTNMTDASIIYAQTTRGISITNNLFLSNHINGSQNSSIYFQDSTFGGYSDSNSIKYNNFTNNVFKIATATSKQDSHTVVRIESTGDTIEYNVFFNNVSNMNSFIHLKKASGSIQYNNFLTNQQRYFIVLDDDGDLTASYNYFGGITNIHQLSDKMDDVCDYLNNGFIMFWPWYESPINRFSDSSDLPPKCTWNIISCDFNGNGICETATPTQLPTTNSPTQSPTLPSIMPTTSPIYTATPTILPSQSPIHTEMPTISPIALPSLSPTVSPTLSPIYSTAPTVSPSSIPSVSPIIFTEAPSHPLTSSRYIETTFIASQHYGNNDDNKAQMTFIWIIIGLIVIILLLAFGCGIVLFRYFKEKAKDKTHQIPLTNMMQSEQ